MNEVQKLILDEIEREGQLYSLRFDSRRDFKGYHEGDYRTSEWYQRETIAKKEHDDRVRLQREALEAQRMDVLHQLRTLPLDQARFLLNAFEYMVDGDRGYGSWRDPMADTDLY